MCCKTVKFRNLACTPLNQSVITLEGSGYDKKTKHWKLCKEAAALWFTPAVSPDVSDSLQAEISGFAVKFSLFCLFSQNLARLSSVFIFFSSPLVIVLYLGSFENNLFELDFLIFKKTCFYGQTLPGSWNFFHDYEIFFEILARCPKLKHFWKYQTLFSKKNLNQSTALNVAHKNCLCNPEITIFWLSAGKIFEGKTKGIVFQTIGYCAIVLSFGF